jgi:septum formation protein
VVGLTYEVIKPDTEEVPRQGETPEAYVLRNALEKGADVVDLLRPRVTSYPHGVIVISADTIVVLDEDILEKPRDESHAAAMLERLSGRTHTVLSGVSLRSFGVAEPTETHFVNSTRVHLKPLSPAEIRSYIRTGEPLDKAGGYAAQGIGSYMVDRIDGSYANVVGLPICQVVEALTKTFAFPLWGD